MCSFRVDERSTSWPSRVADRRKGDGFSCVTSIGGQLETESRPGRNDCWFFSARHLRFNFYIEVVRQTKVLARVSLPAGFRLFDFLGGLHGFETHRHAVSFQRCAAVNAVQLAAVPLALRVSC